MCRLAACVVVLLLVGASGPSWAAWSSNPSQNNPVSLATGNQRQPGMAPDGQGGAFIVFRDTRDSASLGVDIYAQHLDAQGNPLWAVDGVPVVAAPDQQLMSELNPEAVAPDGAGGAFMALVGGPSAQFGPWRGKVQHLNANGTATWGDSGVDVPNANNLHILEDGGGGVFVCGLSVDGNHRILVQHFDGNGVPLWGPDGVVVCSSYIPQSQHMVPDGSGGLVLAWIDFRPMLDNNCDIYAQRIDATGAPLWTANGVALSTAPGQQLNPRLCSDGNGGAIVAWWDAATKRTFARRVIGAGVADWAADGVRLTTHESDQSLPMIANDGAGGAIVAWPDLRSGSTADYYAQRLDASGARLWGDDALPLCAAPQSQQNLAMVSDGAHGVVAAWSDLRVAGTRDLYAQRLGPDGSPLWTIDGIVVGAAEPGGQDQPSIVATGTGAMVAFADWRGPTTDIYAQQISPEGVLGSTVAGVGPGPGTRGPLSVAPLPARQEVVLSFDLRSAGPATLALFDLQGRLLRRIDTAADGSGPHHLRWDLRDEDGHRVGGGVYLARLELAGEILTARVVVVD